MRQSLAFGLGVILCARVARSQTTEVAALIHEGVELRRSGRDGEALERFQRAHARVPSPRTLAQIGFAEQALGRFTDAGLHLQQSLDIGDDSWVRDHRELIEQALREIATHVGSPEALPPEATIAHNPIEPPARLLEMAPAPVRAAQAVRGVELSHGSGARGDAMRTFGWVAVGTGAASLALGFAGLFWRNSLANHWNSELCTAQMMTRIENCSSDRAEARTAQGLSVVGFAAGGALVLTGVVLFLSAPRGARAQGRAGLGAWLSPTSFGLSLGAAL